MLSGIAPVSYILGRIKIAYDWNDSFILAQQGSENKQLHSNSYIYNENNYVKLRFQGFTGIYFCTKAGVKWKHSAELFCYIHSNENPPVLYPVFL